MGHLDGLSRTQRKAVMREQHAYLRTLPEQLTELASHEMPHGDGAPVKVWRSRKYAIQLFEAGAGVLRLSICRSKLRDDGRWEDGLSWDELQSLKSEVGYGSWYAVEVYPADKDVVNVANMRHLWLLPEPLAVGWFAQNVVQP